jgi:hypothetical protein
LKNLKIVIPCKDGEPDVEDIENSNFKYDDGTGVWTIPKLGPGYEGASISLGFDDSLGEDEILPWNVTFDIEKPFALLKIEGCMDMDTDEDIKFDLVTDVKTENFIISN